MRKELEWLKENERFNFYEPNGKIEEFIKLVGSRQSDIYILSTANGVGKTSFVVNLIANLIWPGRNRYFDIPLFKEWPFPKRIRFITDPKLAEEIGPFNSEINKWWPKGKFEKIKGHHSYYSQFTANGWVLDVMTYEQDDFEGGNIGLTITDEPPPRRLWGSLVSRLRAGGIILITMTPLTEAAWIFDELVPNHQQHIVYADVEDACKIHGVRGHLDHERIVSMTKEMNPDEVEARIHGKAMYLKGLIYTFDPSVHIAKAPLSVPDWAQMWHIVDPAVDKPFAMIWGYPGDDGTFYQVSEWPHGDFYSMHNCDLGIEDYKKIIQLREIGWTVKKRIIDRHFADVRSLQTKRTLREDFAAIGIHFDPSYAAEEELETGILRVRSALKYNPSKPIDSLNRPKYVVSPTCTNTIKGFQRWSFDPKTGKIKDEWKDFLDCVRYALMANPKMSVAPPEPTYKKLYG